MKTKFMRLVTVMAMVLSFAGFSSAQLTVTPQVVQLQQTGGFESIEVPVDLTQDGTDYSATVVLNQMVPTMLKLTCSDVDALIYFTTDGTSPSASSTVYNPVESEIYFESYINWDEYDENGEVSPVVIKAIAIKGSEESTIITVTITFDIPAEPKAPAIIPTVKDADNDELTFKKNGGLTEMGGDGDGVWEVVDVPAEGAYIQLSDWYEFATKAYYTTDGTEPSDQSTEISLEDYNAKIEIVFAEGSNEFVLKVYAENGEVDEVTDETKSYMTLTCKKKSSLVLTPVVKDASDQVISLKVVPVGTYIPYRVYRTEDDLTARDVTVALECDATDATITYVVGDVAGVESPELTETYSAPISVKDMFDNDEVVITAAVKAGGEVDTIQVKLFAVPEPDPIYIMAFMSYGDETLTDWQKNGNPDEETMGDLAIPGMVGGDASGIYAYSGVKEETVLRLNLLTFGTPVMYYTLDGTEPGNGTGTVYKVLDSIKLQYPAGKDTLVVKVYATETGVVDPAEAKATFTFTKTASVDPAVAVPVFSRKAGEVESGDMVVVYFDATKADTIFVSHSATAPFAKYLKNDTVVITRDTVIRAFAVKDGVHSDTVENSYTIKGEAPNTVEVEDLAGLNALYKTFDKDMVYTVKGKVTITAIDGSSMWIQDSACAKAAGHSMLLYGVTVPAGAKVGDVMKGVQGKLTVYSNLLEMKDVVAGALKLTGATATVVVDDVKISDLNRDTTMKYQNAMLRFTDVEFVNAGDTIKAKQNYKIFNGNDTIVLRSNAGADYLGMEIPAGKGTIVAYGGFFNKNYQISPRNKADMSFGSVTPVEVAKPTFDPAGGEVEEGSKVTIACATEGAKIYYTIDGSEPTDKSTAYTAAITIDKAVTIKAIAYVGEAKSEVATAAYTIKTGTEGKELAGVSVYPNPSDGEFYVTVPVNATVEVFAVNGKQVASMTVSAGKSLVRLNNAGIYFVRVRANGQDAIRKVVVR